MKITKNFSRSLSLAELIGEITCTGAGLIDVMQNGPEGLTLCFSNYDGSIDYLRLTAQHGPQGAPALNVEFLPEMPKPLFYDDGTAEVPPLAVWDSMHGGYYLADAVKNTVIDPGPIPAEIVEDWTGVQIVGGPAAEDADEDEEDTDAE